MDADFVTTNRAQMVAAIKAVPHDQDTVIEAINKEGAVLVRYTFHYGGGAGNSRQYHEKHVRRLARAVMKTPTTAWR